jgi:CspA family cold shock protein
MGDRRQVVTCQRCGMSFVMTPNYADFLARHGIKVVLPVQCLNCYWKAGPVPKQRGRVKWFNARRGYGFIVGEGEQELFFHQNQLVGENNGGPHEGQAARFHVGYAAKGPQALNVELASG